MRDELLRDDTALAALADKFPAEKVLSSCCAPTKTASRPRTISRAR
jgi:hypothetical protein